MSPPSDVDLDRAHQTLFGAGTWEERIARLIVEVRTETRAGVAAEVRECLPRDWITSQLEVRLRTWEQKP